jgi:signal transduction histidine kinase
LAAGDFLDLRKNCEHFLSTLLSRKGFASAAVWILTEALPQPEPRAPDSRTGLELVYGAPRVQIRERAVSTSHPLWTRLGEGGAYAVAATDAAFASLVTEADVHGGVFAVFPLDDFGFLKVHAGNRKEPLDDVELSQIGTVVRKFASSLRGGIAHEKLRLESAERERAQQERQAIAEQLQQAQKMEAIGRLAGGIAHDFNNLLVAVLGNAELLLQETPQGSVLREDAQAIVTAAQRAAHLTKQLLTFSRKDKRQFVVLRPDQLIDEVVALLKRTLDPKIQIEVRLGLADNAVTGDPSQLHTALLNLALNARDAMPTGGTLTFASALVGRPAGIPPEAPPVWARLSVTDTGVGMSEDIAAKVFEPFFTTKAIGQGTGLGLATVYGIVEGHGGRIALETAPHRGTRFDVYLPASEVAAPPLTREDLGDLLRGKGLVLLVDDDVDSRATLARMLKALGYEVIEAGDGTSALAAAQSHAGSLRAVVLDLRMPGMTGAET